MSLTQKMQRYLIQLNTHSHGSAADCLEEACFIQMAKLDQLEHTDWVGWDESKLEKESCTTLHIPEHANTSQHDSGTCQHKPTLASTFRHDRGIAF